MQSNPIVWFEIYVQDMQRAKAFYEAVFGVQLAKLDSPDINMAEMWAFPMQRDSSGATGALAKMPGGPAGGGNSTIVYFACNDCAVEAQRAVAHGGKVFKDKFAIGQYGFIALIVDTENNMIGLHSMQ